MVIISDFNMCSVDFCDKIIGIYFTLYVEKYDGDKKYGTNRDINNL